MTQLPTAPKSPSKPDPLALDPTPVADLEEWCADYDPATARQLDDLLDEAFGPAGPSLPTGR